MLGVSSAVVSISLVQDKSDTESLLSSENVNREALLSYAKEAASFSTNYQLPKMEFALNHQNLPDVDMFDFTCMNRSENAALVYEHSGAQLLIGLVGDCLVEVRMPSNEPGMGLVLPPLRVASQTETSPWQCCQPRGQSLT